MTSKKVTVALGAKRIMLALLTVGVLSSCTSTNVVKGVWVKLEKPQKVLRMDRDSSFIFDFPQTIGCGGLELINDSILFLYNQPYEEDSLSFYRAYSLSDFSYLGTYLTKGRGPGEYLDPVFGGQCLPMDKEIRCEYVFDLMLNRSFAYDFPLSMEVGRDISYPISELPKGTLYAYAYCDTLQFLINKGSGSLLAQLADSKGSIIKTTDLYPGVVSENNYPRFSNSVEINSERGLVAMLMSSLPQINFLNPVTGEIRSYAVNKAYRNWKRSVNINDVNSIITAPMYYISASSTPDYIIAIYMNMAPVDLRGPSKGVHVHIFDWDGIFLYDIMLNEGISSVAYDSARKHLYGLDVLTEHIYRYDLSSILKID